MNLSNFNILYVSNVQQSVDFYQTVFNQAPVNASNAFAMFAEKSGLKLGLWDWQCVDPKLSTLNPGSMEMALEVNNITALNNTLTEWKNLNIPIIQEITDMSFGTTFTALDPDGHRLRIFCYEKAKTEQPS